MPHKVVLFTTAALVPALYKSISSPRRRAGVLLAGTTLIVGVDAWVEVHLTPFNLDLWWTIPFILAVFLYPVGVGWIRRSIDTRKQGVALGIRK